MIEKVPLYENLGFSIKCAQGAQVAMRIGEDYEMNIADSDYVHSQSAVKAEIEKLMEKHGHGVIKIEAEYEAATNLLHQDVSRYVSSRQKV